MLPYGSGIPPSAPHTGQVAFTTSGALGSTQLCLILAMFPYEPLGDTLYRVLVLGSFGLDLRSLLQALSSWFSFGFCDGRGLLGLYHSVHMSHYYGQGLSDALLRYVRVTISLG